MRPLPGFLLLGIFTRYRYDGILRLDTRQSPEEETHDAPHS